MADSRNWYVTGKRLEELRQLVQAGELLVSGQDSGQDSEVYLATLEDAAKETGRMSYGYLHRAVDQVVGPRCGDNRRQAVSAEAQRLWHGLLAGQLSEDDSRLARLSFEANDRENAARGSRSRGQAPGSGYLALTLQLHDLRREVKVHVQSQGVAHREVSAYLDRRTGGAANSAGARPGNAPESDPVAQHIWQVLCSHNGHALAGGSPAGFGRIDHNTRVVVVEYPRMMPRRIADQVAWLAADAVNRAFDVGDQPYQVLVQLAGNR
jgi:hypothetical protein